MGRLARRSARRLGDRGRRDRARISRRRYSTIGADRGSCASCTDRYAVRHDWPGGAEECVCDGVASLGTRHDDDLREIDEPVLFLENADAVLGEVESELASVAGRNGEVPRPEHVRWPGVLGRWLVRARCTCRRPADRRSRDPCPRAAGIPAGRRSAARHRRGRPTRDRRHGERRRDRTADDDVSGLVDGQARLTEGQLTALIALVPSTRSSSHARVRRRDRSWSRRRRRCRRRRRTRLTGRRCCRPNQSSTALTRHAEDPPVGLLEVSKLPSSTATQSVTEAHEIAA